ncbi:MAG: arylsulfatase [Lentisphaeria bacterium]|nr:arylsulfatase [Lentisphaeria bacterium]
MKKQAPANILLILNDDMGFSDLGCYGGEIRTPHLDRLAAGGVRFTQFFNTARCCPARASLLTGLYPHQAGVGWMTTSDMGGSHEGYAGDLNDRCRTLPEVLRPSGYHTAMSGKWHVTSRRFTRPEGPRHSWPLQRGFERFYGIIDGAANYWRPESLTRGNTWVGPRDLPEGYYLTDAIADSACDFLDEHPRQHPGTPFFHYVAFTAPHWPLHARAEDIEPYRQTYTAGWDRMRPAKLERMRSMGIVDPGWDLSARDGDIPDWGGLSADRQAEFAFRMAVYSAQIECMDRGIGRIVERLRETGQLERTLILFLSDNGGCAEEIHRGGFRHWSEIGQAHTYESYGKPWANYSNTPFREYKHWVHEGGIATPLIAHWPEGIRNPGRLEHQPGHLIDIMATCIELSGAAYPPPGSGSARIHPLPGRSLLPAFGERPLVREGIFWEHEANRALRDGPWKLVAKAGKEWELYDMAADRTETRDLASAYPERVREMAERWDAIARVTAVYPLFPEKGMDYGQRSRMASWEQAAQTGV